MTDKEQKVEVSVFNWGPCVVKLKMMDDFKQLLLDEAKNNKKDFRDKLAGIIEKETGYSEESKAKVVPMLANYLGVYDQMFERFINKKYEKKQYRKTIFKRDKYERKIHSIPAQQSPS